MPGTPEEYASDPKTSEAAGLIDQAISEQKSGSEIIEMLEGSGLRIYPSEETEEAPMEEALSEEPPLEDTLPEEEPLPMSDMGMGDEPKSGQDGGMRDLRIDAVRFALDKDKKNKEQDEEEIV